jgi:hypothetical protein
MQWIDLYVRAFDAHVVSEVAVITDAPIRLRENDLKAGA